VWSCESPGGTLLASKRAQSWGTVFAASVRDPGGIVIRKIAALMIVLFLAACETSPRPALRWVKSGGSAEDLEHARAACENQAMKQDLGVDDDTLQAQGRANVFMRCMNERGWQQVLPKADD
jgi:hypothetical protein